MIAPALRYRTSICERRLPPDGIAAVLLLQPFFERREVVADGRGIHLAGARDFLEGFLPRAARAHSSMELRRAPAALLSKIEQRFRGPVQPAVLESAR